MITIRMEDENIANFALALVRTAPRSVPDLVGEVTTLSEEVAKVRMCQLLAEIKLYHSDASVDEETRLDGEVTCLISNKLKLRCPLSMERVKEPVRGERCWHLQCFGLRAYLESNLYMRAFNNRWTCPVCSNVLHPSDLRIDGFVERVLADTSEAVEEVEIDAEGNWKTLTLNPDLVTAPVGSPHQELDLDADPLPEAEVEAEAAAKRPLEEGVDLECPQAGDEGVVVGTVTMPKKKRKKKAIASAISDEDGEDSDGAEAVVA